MIRGLGPPLEDPQPTSRIPRSFGQNLGKLALADVMRAGTGDQDPTRFQEAHGSVVDFLVSAKGGLEAFLVPGESRGVQNDGVVSSALVEALAEEVKNICLNKINVVYRI
jgi:hypothetical protein